MRSRVRTVPEKIRDVSDAVAGGTALDLEDEAAERRVTVTRAGRQQLPDPGGELVHARAPERGAAEDGMDERPRASAPRALRKPRRRHSTSSST